MKTTKNKMILSVSADAKTVKGVKQGYLTGILYLAPADLSGKNICPFAELAGCKNACLYSAGRGAFNSVQRARLAKTDLFNHDKETFFSHLVYSIKKVVKQAQKLGLVPVIRLNGTSDIQFEKIAVTVDSVRYTNIFEVFKNVQFYDYTKIPTRSKIPKNYDLTFSYSGVESFQPSIKKALKNKNLRRVAAVFSHADRMPETFLGRKTVNGDNTDLRFLDSKNVVVALYAKGRAKRDNSGFVVQV